MSAILVPVDFSLPSHNAYRFALHLAKEFKQNVVLAHYSPGSLDLGQPLTFSGDGSLHDSYLSRLRDFANSSVDGVDYPALEPPAGVEVSYETEVVFSVSAAIINRAARVDITAVVMPPRSTNRLLEKWLGSTSTTVSESCNRPVYIVPDGVTFRPFKHIVVANNHTSAEAFPLWQINGAADLFGAQVHFVHVEWPQRYGPLRFVPWELMEKLISEDGEANYPFEMVTVKKNDITAGLLEYSDSTDADLLVIVNSVRNRWRSLLQATLTQDLILRSKRPLLVLHTTDVIAGEGITEEDEKVN